MSTKKGHYDVHRSGIQVGMQVLSDGYHVQWKARYETISVASFWIGEKQPAETAEKRANALANELNGGKL